MKLKKLSFALACGIMWGLTVFLATIWILIRGGEGQILSRLNLFYIGYSVTPVGSFIGLIWGFIDGFISGLFFSWLYNAMTKCKETKEITEK